MIQEWRGGSLLVGVETEAAIRIRGQAAAYGAGCPFLPIWTTEHGGAVSLLDGAAVLAIGEEDWEESALFLSMRRDVTSVRTDARTAAYLADRGSGGDLQTGQVMRLERPFPERPGGALTPSPGEVYPLLAACFPGAMPPFEAWYVDVSHRLRHGAGRLAVVRQGGEIVSTAMSVAECEGAALLGAVATRADCRKKGYAAACLSALIRDLGNRQIYIAPKNEPAARLYAELGFAVCGEWGALAYKQEG